MQNKKQSRRKTLCVEVERNKMPDPEEDQAGPKVPVQTGRFRPISDRYPQLERYGVVSQPQEAVKQLGVVLDPRFFDLVRCHFDRFFNVWSAGYAGAALDHRD